MAAERQALRVKFSMDGSMVDAGARLETVIRWMTEQGLTVEAAAVENPGAVELPVREQPPTAQTG
jgi:hypothetical protein